MKKAWTESASLIVVAKNKLNKQCGFDYSLLALKRHENSKFHPSKYVFPGGLIEPQDASLEWKEFLGNFDSLLHKSKLDIFRSNNPNELPREISLRISAIRETFEESGLLFCKHLIETNKSNWAQHFEISQYDSKLWRKRVYSDPGEFLNLCREFKCYPNLWALQEWSLWLTPAMFPTSQRFNSIFFLTFLSEIPEETIGHQEEEMDDLVWKTPEAMLSSPEINLAPPQLYEISTMHRFKTIEDYFTYAQSRRSEELKLNYPVPTVLEDGLANLLPGDSEYPKVVNLMKKEILYKSNMSIEEFRNSSAVLNRLECFSNDTSNFVSRNSLLDEQFFKFQSGNNKSKL